MFDIDLNELSKLKKEEYKNNTPYPNIVIDNLISDDVLNKVLEEFPSPKNWYPSWGMRNDQYQKKYGSRGRELIGSTTIKLIDELNSQPFLDFLSELTGIKDLLADLDLIGAGLHQITRGGYLAIHADFNKTYHRDRRLNLLLYLNKNWQEEWRGNFEMWNADLSKKVKSISPIFNRMVIFNTNETSYHGHPKSLICPSDITRKSIALYYYTKGRDDNVSENFKSNYVDTNWKTIDKKVKLF